MKEWLRSLPAIHEIQKQEHFLMFLKKHGLSLELGTSILKQTMESIRQSILLGAFPVKDSDRITDFLYASMEESVKKKLDYTLKRVINGTGTILHTNLGRARLSEAAINHVISTAHHYSNLEYELEEGKRGSRHNLVENIVKELTGAEAAMIVNNNAAAVYLILAGLVRGKQAIVSRGQLVEIGGSFRISSIMEESGAHLVEVGTTNKTHLQDYEQAINSETKMIMKVHTSNFRTIGFTKTVSTTELANLTKNYPDVIFYEDLGSGALIDLNSYGIGDEPVVREVLKMGADLVSFSGDKLLGGPQAGIIAGKKEYIDQLKKHQLARVLRVDKMTLAALEATLLQYVKGHEYMLQIPAIRDLLTSADSIKNRIENFLSHLKGTNELKVTVRASVSQVGGGTLPDVELPTFVLAITHSHFTAEEIVQILRTENSPAIVGRIQKDEFLLDFRTITPEEEICILEALINLKTHQES